MRDAIEKLVNDHIRVAAQYESVGDAASAAKLRAIANMVASILDGKDAGTILPPLTEEDCAAIKAKEREIEQHESSFAEAWNVSAYDDFDYRTAYSEASRRVIDLVVRRPKSAPTAAWLKGLRDGLNYIMNTVRE